AVPMYDLFGRVGEVLAHVSAAVPGGPGDVVGGVLGDALAERPLDPVLDNPDGVPGREAAVGAGDADRKQARPALAQPPRGARVDEHRPGRLLRVFEPQLVRREPPLDPRGEARPDLLPGGRRGELP